jgi:enhancing lycopene biosynthesis protein 2
MKPFGIFLSGCGYEEGTDIWEAVLLNYFLEEKKIKIIHLYSQSQNIDRSKKDVNSPRVFSRNLLSEIGAIAQGNLKELKDIGSDSLDALIFPGGEGILKNFTQADERNPVLKIDPELKKFIRETYRRKRPMAGCGVSSLVIASALRDIVTSPLTLTSGSDPKLSDQLEKMGVNHIITKADEAVIDSDNRLVTTPGSKIKTNLTELGKGLKNLIDGILELTK